MRSISLEEISDDFITSLADQITESNYIDIY